MVVPRSCVVLLLFMFICACCTSSGKAECLYNMPIKAGMLPISASTQSVEEICQQITGQSAQPSYNQTSNTDAICSGVWCNTSADERCVFIQSPVLEGLTCGTQKVCLNGTCVLGGWSDWSAYSLCSATCGKGLQYQERHCIGDNNDCDGRSRRYRMCRTQPCPLGSEDTRISQCASFNDMQFKDGSYYNWIPHLAENPLMECQLTCKPEEGKFFALLAPSIPDGTMCDMRHNGVCVGGKCQMVGCDGVIESEAVGDECGICGGNGTSCSSVSATFRRHNLTYGYQEVVRLPVGSVGINVTEVGGSINYLALRNGLDSSRYYVNGYWRISQPGIYSAASTSVFYRRVPDSSETMWINGPLKEPLVIVVLVQNSNAHISYRYRVNNKSAAARSDATYKRYMWRFTVWTNCSQRCAGGVQTRQLVCHDTKTGSDIQQRPCYPTPHSTQLSRPCNMKTCPPEWSVGSWVPQQCPVTCGPGGTRKRDAHCVIRVSPTTTRLVKNRLCDRKNKPPSKETCNTFQCPLAIWFEGQWSPCSVSCGEGQQKREILCKDKHGYSRLSFRDCDAASQPTDIRLCTMPQCPKEAACRDVVTACKFLGANNMCRRPSYYQLLCCRTCKKLSGSFSSGSTYS